MFFAAVLSPESLNLATLVVGLMFIALAIVACIRRVDVRLALFLASLALGLLAGARDVLQQLGAGSLSWNDGYAVFAKPPMAIIQSFLKTLADEKFVVPICCAMGFAHVLRLTQCDRHLVQLLIRPLRRVRALLVPGTVLVAFVVNIPVISQTSTAVTVGFVLIPLLRAGGISPLTSGAALLLGSSLGGELLNPGAPEFGTIAEATGLSPKQIVAWILPYNLLHLAVTTALFWVLSSWADRRRPADQTDQTEVPPDFHVHWHKALVPLVPFAVLFIVGPPLEILKLPTEWLADPKVPPRQSPFNSRLVGAAMLVGVAAALLTTPKALKESARVFFDGAGYAFTYIIALIVTATCFGKGVELIGLAELLSRGVASSAAVLLPAAGFLPLGFAVLCGSGMAATQSLFPFFVGPAQAVDIPPGQAGALVSLGAAAGRTMSPVSAVTLMCGRMTDTNPLHLVKRIALPLLIGMVAVVAVASAGR